MHAVGRIAARNARGMAILATAITMLGIAEPVTAADYRVGDVNLRLLSTFTLGAAIRTQERDNSLLGKLNVPGQQDLCNADDCLSLSGDPAPNQRLIDAEGGFFFVNTDDGNMNYDRGDLVAALAKLNADVTATWRGFVLRAELLAYFDAANANFSETKFNTRWQDASQPRSGEIERDLAVRFDYRSLFVGTAFDFLDREINLSVGYQRIRWGEANLHLFGTVDAINPQDAILGRQPGLAINELNRPTASVLINTDIGFDTTLEMFYQLKWDPARPEPAGSFFSTSDIAGKGEYAIIGLGQFSEDPEGIAEPAPPISVFSSSHRTINVPGQRAFAPPDDGQYGVKLSRFFMDLNQGTEIGLYYANLHSRLPYLSAFAADRSCVRDTPGNANLVSAIISCEGLNGTLLPVQGREPLPVDTLRLFLDYPRNVEMYGISFNTPAGRWSLYGEYNYRPREAVQILLSDVVFAGLQPAFPQNDFPVAPLGLSPNLIAGALAGLPLPVQDIADIASGVVEFLLIDPNVTIPGARTFVPDYLSGYRGVEIQEGDYVRGYERLGVGQAVIGGTRLFSTNPIGAEDILMLLEAGFNHVRNLPDPMTELPLQGAGDITHPSPGADGTGAAPGQEGITQRINPTQQTDGFVTRFSWGVRGLIQAQYANVFRPGITLRPTLIFFADINGIAPSPAQNYVEGNRWLLPGLEFQFGQNFGGILQYQYFAGSRNLLRDRDNLSLTLNYSF
jgi:hypothetical protein